jgi:hypothetical protein
MKLDFKKLLPHLVAIAVFLALSMLYFSPVFDGYRLKQGDVTQFRGMEKEIADYRMLNGEEALWTNSMFGGMPAYQISVAHDSNWLSYVDRFLRLGLPGPVGILFVAMLGFYIFALCLRIKPWLGIIGAIAFGFSTITILYLGAGHITKVKAITYMAPALGGLLLAFRGKWLLGSAVFGLFFGLNLSSNHLQMTYYLSFLLAAVALTETIRLLIAKHFQELLKVFGGLALAAILAVLPSIGNLWTTYEYSKYTTRGSTDLTIKPKDAQQSNLEKEGLASDYILEYNFGKMEWMSFFAPNIKGAKDDLIGNDQAIMANVDYTYADQISKMNRYWGGQRMSGGAFYFGVVMVVFFVFGLLFLKDTITWPFLAIAILSILLASENPGGINDFFINKFPLYNKFRDSKMILVLIQLMVPGLGMLFLDRFLKKEDIRGTKKHWLIGGAGILLFLIVIYASPSISGSFLRSDEVQQFNQVVKESKDAQQIDYINGLKGALVQTRIDIYKSDISRAILLVFVALGLILVTVYTKISNVLVVIVAAIAVFGDNWSVAKRYLNHEEQDGIYRSFEDEATAALPYLPQLSDISILAQEKTKVPQFESHVAQLMSAMPTAPNYATIESTESLQMLAEFGALNLNSDYRVLNFNNPFNETATSYFHKSLGGYHGAKLKRYQELIDFQIFPAMSQVNTEISAEKNKMLQAYALNTPPVNQEQAQAIFDTIQLSSIALSEKATVLNMLNTKYIVVKPNQRAILNTSANGNAWFVDTVVNVKNANAEMSGLAGLNSKTTALVNIAEFAKSGITAKKAIADSTAKITLAKYQTKVLKYKSKSAKAAPAIFSEIYYPEGWNCYIDGKLTPTFRANYILRGVMVPAGSHAIEWRFEPASFQTASTYGTIGSLGLFAACILIFGLALKGSLLDKSEEALIKES